MTENPQMRLLSKLALLAAFIEHRWPGAAKQRAKCAEVAERVGRMDPVNDEVLLRAMTAKIDASVAELGATDG